VPPIDDAVKRIIEPNPELFAEKELKRFCSVFQLKKNRKTEKAYKRFWRDKPLLSEEADNDLQREVGGYESVVVFRPIKVVDEDLLESLQQAAKKNGSR